VAVTKREQQSVEAATRDMVNGMGTLTPRQQVVAATAYRVAANLDAEEDGSKAAALSRELRQLVGILQPLAGAGPTAHKDPVAALQDEVAKKRRQREQGA
jgi:hypothetical protein